VIAFDTNYLVRHLVQDDPLQCQEVANVVERETVAGRRILLFDLVLCETIWVLRSSYHATRKDCLLALQALAGSSIFTFEDRRRYQQALKRFAAGNADFSDYLLMGKAEESKAEILTFDQSLRRSLREQR